MSHSTPKKKRAPAGTPEKFNPMVLMRAMGADSYDPIPPDCYRYAMDPAFNLTLSARRLYAWQLWRSIGSKRGGRTPFCRDSRGDLTLKHAREDLEIPFNRLSEAQAELEAKGMSSRDAEGHLFPAGKIPYNRRRKEKGEEKAVPCTELIPPPIFLYFQSLGKERSAQCEHDYVRLIEWGQRIKAEALGTARDAEETAIGEYLRRVGFEAEEGTRGAPRKDRPAVQLQLIELPQLSVDLEFCTKFGGISNKIKTPTEQNGATLFGPQRVPQSPFGNSHRRGGNVENSNNDTSREESEVAAQAPRCSPFSDQNLSEDGLDAAVDELARTIEALTGQALMDAELRERFAAIPQALDIPETLVCQFLRTKVGLVREHPQLHNELRTPESLYALLNDELAVWLRQGAR